MFPSTWSALGFSLCLAAAGCLTAQTKSGPDVMILVDGEKLIGHLISANEKAVVFKSDLAGPITIPWASIQELKAPEKYAVVHKDLELRNREDAGQVPQGTLEMTNQKLEVTASPQGAAKEIPVSKVSNVVSEQSFERAFRRQGFFEGWKGLASLGFALTQSTVKSRNFTSSLELSRADPDESWMKVRNRTSLGFNQVYGRTSGTPDTIFSLIHADALRDHYLSDRWFIFAGATFDHNYTQGLDLLQAYGGGVGAVVIKNDRSELDARVGLGYMHQSYSDPTLNRNLLGSRINESYTRTFSHGIVLAEMAGIRPAWNDMKNYFAGFTVNLSVPVYRRLSMNVYSFDSYVNNPPPYFKKNSFQISMGASYTIK